MPPGTFNLIQPGMNAPHLEISGSPHIIDWLQELEISLAFTTYQTCRLFLVGIKPDGRLSAFERMFDQAIGLYTTPERLHLSTKYQLWQLDNVLALGQLHNGYDKVYVPRIGYTTGDLDIHDVAVNNTGRLVFVCTRLNCLATVSQRHSCTPLWRPPFNFSDGVGGPLPSQRLGNVRGTTALRHGCESIRCS